MVPPYVRSDPSDPKSPLLISDKPGPGYGMPIVGSQNAVLARWILIGQAR